MTAPVEVLTFTVPDNTCKKCTKSLSDCNCEGAR